MRTKSVIASVAFATFVAGASVAQATTYDISDDFALSNPNGVWAYGYTTDLVTGTLYDQSSTVNNIQIWQSSIVQSLGAPSDFNNPTNGAIQTCGSCTSLPAHTAAFHPGPNGEYSFYRFTSPSSGLFSLSAVFGALDSGGTDVHILVNGVSIFSHAIDNGSNTSASFNSNLTLALGDHVDFAVGWGADQGFFFDSTSIDATLNTIDASQTPLPAALPLFTTGLGALGLLGWRRKRKVAALAA